MEFFYFFFFFFAIKTWLNAQFTNISSPIVYTIKTNRLKRSDFVRCRKTNMNIVSLSEIFYRRSARHNTFFINHKTMSCGGFPAVIVTCR